MFIPISFRTSFEDVYNITEYTVPEYTGTRLEPTGNNVYIHFCFFEELTSSEDGGAIYCRGSVQRLLVEQSSFISCKTSDDRGGGICSYSSQCVLSKICAFKCYSTYSYDRCIEEEDPWFCSYSSDGQFAYISAKYDITCKNHVNDSSITHTLKDNTDPRFALCLYDGNILCTSVNLTNNECEEYTALNCCPPSSNTYRISYNSIVNNTSNGGHSCIWLRNSVSDLCCIDTCNILNNKQTATYFGTIMAHANILIKNSCILGNNEGNMVFYALPSRTITISNCTIDDDIFSKTRYYGSVTVNKTIERPFINALSHIAIRKCDSYFDSYGTLTVNPIVPDESSLFLISNIKKLTIVSFRSMIFIFLITMVPSDPADYYYFYSNCIFASEFCE